MCATGSLSQPPKKWREDDVEYEHYTDSGESPRTEEKLAYTVLAASLPISSP